jgi:hypothetical protein
MVRGLEARELPAIVPLYFSAGTVWASVADWKTQAGGAAPAYPGETGPNGDTYGAIFNSNSPANCTVSTSETVPYMSITG